MTESKDIAQKRNASVIALRFAMDVLISIRRMERITIEEVAKKGNMSKSTISKIEGENTELPITYDLLSRYCEAVDVDFPTMTKFVSVITDELTQNNMELKENKARDKFFRFMQVSLSTQQ